ncbi:hypothetical protein D3C87_1973880 [compost metagenome]
MKATVVKAASLYQVNTGLVTVVLLATNLAEFPEQNGASAPATLISVANAGGLTVTVTALAVAAVFSHLLDPLTVT